MSRVISPSGAAVHYLATHWRGRQGLWWSFTVNLVGLRALLLVAQDALAPAPGAHYHELAWLVLVLALLGHGAVFIWQVVGVVRACDSHLRGGYSMPALWGVQAGVVVAFWLTATAALGCWQMTLPDDAALNSGRGGAGEHAGKYRFDVNGNGQILTLTGSIELGMTSALRDRLVQQPRVSQVILSSAGGNIYAARGVAKLIRERGLDTRVNGQCTSACTTLFIGGRGRILGPGARLGYHRYRVDANYQVLLANPVAEQQRDRALHADADVKLWFLDKMFQSDAASMWFPTQAQLLEAGVATQVVR